MVMVGLQKLSSHQFQQFGRVLISVFFLFIFGCIRIRCGYTIPFQYMRVVKPTKYRCIKCLESKGFTGVHTPRYMN